MGKRNYSNCNTLKIDFIEGDSTYEFIIDTHKQYLRQVIEVTPSAQATFLSGLNYYCNMFLRQQIVITNCDTEQTLIVIGVCRDYWRGGVPQQIV